jgi:flagellar protein FliS
MNQAMQINRYRATDIRSLGPEKLIVLIYEKLESKLGSARNALQVGDSPGMIQDVNAAQRIIMELRNALNHDVGGEVTLNLESLYDFMFQENLALLVDHQGRHLNYLDQVVRPLLNAWRQVPAGSAEKALTETRGTAPQDPRNLGPVTTGADPARSRTGSFSLAV